MVTSDGASSSSAAATESEYQVFLSFRGEDTRKTFTDHLYWYLRDAGIRTFRDNEELHVGKEIGADLLRAIEKSSISVPIISKGYASSKWCLIELTHMLKCRKTRGRPEVYPIFYGVTPSDCKDHETGCFAKALQELGESRPAVLQEWKDALREVTQLKGWEKDKIEDGHEGKLVNIIASDICMKLKRNNVEITTDKLVGMGHHVEAMKQLMEIDCNDDVRVIGIHGMGGIGKTTIAKFLFNELGSTHFQHQCSFLEDIRENLKVHKSYDVLRNQLILDILKRKPDGISFNRNTFRDKKVLVVLDDVEERSQVSAIIRSRDWFGPGSRIIVTTRNKEVFEEREADRFYEPELMNYYNSLLLFTKHAFRSTQPPEDFQDISREVILAAAGLPLSLVVIGSLLYGKEKTKWEATWKKLKAISPKEVQERLKISYDDLDHEQKQIFLDIACHFIGQDKTFAFYMWDDCGHYPESGVEVLISLALITIGEDNVIRMHDQLRDLGRRIVYLESPNDPGQRSRLWSPEEAEQVLRSKSGTRKVETFSMTSGWGSASISNDNLKGLSNLRYLHLEGSGGLEGDFEGFASNLRWFKWCFKDSVSEFDLRFIGSRDSGFWNRLRTPITNFCPNKLVILDLSGSHFSNGWESLIQIKAAANLKVLTLSGCPQLTKLPECLWNLKSLVELDLSHTGITELSDQGIGNLTNLIQLNLSNNWGIKKLPEMGIERLQKLQVLDCSHSRSLKGELPVQIWSLPSLRILNLEGSTGISGCLPKDISGLAIRETLLLSENIQLPPAQGLELPLSITRLCIPLTEASFDSLRSLVNLRNLTFYRNSNGYCCELLVGMGVVPPAHRRNSKNTPFIDMSNLESLTLRGFDDHLKRCRLLPAMKFDSSSRLKRLCIDSYKDVISPLGLLDLSNCQMLKSLEITKCPWMREIADFGNRSLGTSWEFITINYCDCLEVLSDLSNMKRLRTLFTQFCPKLREIKGLEVLTSLKSLLVNNCPHMKKDQLESDLSNSKSLKFRYLPDLDQIYVPPKQMVGPFPVHATLPDVDDTFPLAILERRLVLRDANKTVYEVLVKWSHAPEDPSWIDWNVLAQRYSSL